ncbi:hypothetical protein FW778_20965 [Ginsengibacter hankyongi]|uniref:Outer membrane protein beta-barrel domain-containing protein n=1 Tax=Ginsengibacter hankyongi TaxID=2607284 RepID=A0A5J5IFR9_9BACT|nr:hypothetical protein [Ginsengibacter hankyongi]KAA9035698.1 hypothetical protein FW778_20965 [Ginsengibacter hankyongi]
MLKLTIITLALSLACTTGVAQKNTYIGIEGAANNDVYDIIDNGPALKKVPLITGYFGLNIRQDISSTVFLETGLLRKYYDEGIGFKGTSSYTEGNAINAWLIPLRLGIRLKLLNLRKQKLYFVPVIGYVLGINSDYGYGDGGEGGSETMVHDTISYNVYSKLSLRRTFPLLQTGMGVEFLLLRTVLISVNANYYTGFKNLIEQNIEYTRNSVSNTAKGLSKGEIMSFGLSAKYPISHIWRKHTR